MISLKTKIQRVIEDYVDASIAVSWKGSRLGEEHAEIEADFNKARKAKDELVALIVSALNKAGVIKL